MPRLILFAVLLLFCGATSAGAGENSFAVDRVADGVFAAIARPGSRATSNALFLEGKEYVIAAGAHLTRESMRDLTAAVAAVTAKPVRYYILTHHHRGYDYLDFDFPPERDVIMSWQTWQALSAEGREIPFPALFFNDGITLKLGDQTVILTHLEQGHTQGDTLLFLPESQVLFASDLLYFDSVGYLGEGHMQAWALALELIERLEAETIVPGYGPVGNRRDLAAFRSFFRDFLTAVLQHIEKGESLEQLQRTFSLPAYEHLDGYRQFLKVNLERAYHDLKTDFPSS